MVKKAGISLVWIFILLMSVVSSVVATDFGPRRPRNPKPPSPIGVSEPAAIALLGAGLVSLGIYAKKKRGKKQ